MTNQELILTNDTELNDAFKDIREDIFEFNIRFTPCPECGGRSSCMSYCSTKYWPLYGHDIPSHPRYELANEGRKIKSNMVRHVLSKFKKLKKEGR